MNIKKNAIVSNSEMIKNYKACREKAEELGKVFIIKRNHPDAVLFSIDEYEKRSPEIERQEAAEEAAAEKVIVNEAVVPAKIIRRI
jgi:PHD/YefM family antitoxin component YafN of YafNO toxin-antitoxin module